MASPKTESSPTWFVSPFKEPDGWPGNAVAVLVAAICFTLPHVRGYGGWVTVGWILVVLAIAESVPAERTALAGTVRIGGMGLILLAAIVVDFGLVA